MSLKFFCESRQVSEYLYNIYIYVWEIYIWEGGLGDGDKLCQFNCTFFILAQSDLVAATFL